MAHKSRSEEALQDYLVRLDKGLVAWLDKEAIGRERSRSWLINHICRMYRQRLEGERKRAEKRKGKAYGKAVH